MKSINEYLSYKMVIVPDETESGYVVLFPDLPGCITSGETIQEAIGSFLKD